MRLLIPKCCARYRVTTGFNWYGDPRSKWQGQASKQALWFWSDSCFQLIASLSVFSFEIHVHVVSVWKLSFTKLTLSDRPTGPLRLITLAHWHTKLLFLLASDRNLLAPGLGPITVTAVITDPCLLCFHAIKVEVSICQSNSCESLTLFLTWFHGTNPLYLTNFAVRSSCYLQINSYFWPCI